MTLESLAGIEWAAIYNTICPNLIFDREDPPDAN